MTTAEIDQEMLKSILDAGKSNGYLTFDELNELLPPEVTSSEEMDDVIIYLMRHRVLVLDSPVQAPLYRKLVGLSGGLEDEKALKERERSVRREAARRLSFFRSHSSGSCPGGFYF